MKQSRPIILALFIVAGITLYTCKQPEIFSPQITKIIPETVTAGHAFKIAGDKLAFGNYVKIDTTKLTYDMKEDTALVFLPKDFPAGTYQLHIESVEENSNELPITILPAEIEINADSEVNVGDLLTINGKNFIAPVSVILCAGSSDSITVKNPSIKSETEIEVFIPVKAAFDRDSKKCSIEINSNSVGSTSIDITINNPKNPTLTTTNFTEVFQKDTITLIGQHLVEEGLKITIGGIPITDPIIKSPSSLQIVIPPGISEVGKIVLTTKYGIVEANYSEDDSSNRIPMIDADNPTDVYSDDSLKIRGKNFTKYPMEVLLNIDGSSDVLLENSAYQLINDSFIMISLPKDIQQGEVLFRNEFGDSRFSFKVSDPPIIQTSLTKSNPANGPLYIYGQNLLKASSVVFKSPSGQETEVTNIVKYRRCFDTSEIGDTCQIVTLNVPNLTPGNYEIFVSIKEGGNEIKRSKEPLRFEVLTNYNGNTLAGTGNTNIVLPNPPFGTPIVSVQNTWFIINNLTSYQLIEPETPPVNGVQFIYDDFNNLIGDYRKDASFVQMDLQGIHYFGQFDTTYFDADDRYYVRKMVLIPEEQGNVVILLDKKTAIDSLNHYQFHAGEEIIAYGHFLDTSYEMVFRKHGTTDQSFIIEDFTDTTLKLILPEDILSGTYTIYLDWGEFDFYSNRKTIKIME